MDLHNEFESSKFFHRARIDRRAADTLVGFAAGITADGVVNITEAVFFLAMVGKQSRAFELSGD